MANPNILNVFSIYGKTALVRTTANTATSVLANAAASGKVLKLAGALATNREGVNVNVACSMWITRGGVQYFLARNVTIPAMASYEVFLKDSTPIYLQEGDELWVQSGNASGLIDVMVAYEEIE